MERLDRAWFEQAAFPHSWECGTRFADLDPLGHINNVAMAAILEDARVRLSSAINGDAGLKPFRILIAAHLLNYVAEAYYPALVHVSSGIRAIGKSSWQLAQIARQDGRTVALACCALVAEEGGRSVPIGTEFERALRRFEIA